MREFGNVCVKSVQDDALGVGRRDGDPLSALKSDARVSDVVVFEVDDDFRRRVNAGGRFVVGLADDVTSGQVLIPGAPVGHQGLFERVPDSKLGVVGDADDRQKVWVDVEATNLVENVFIHSFIQQHQN